MEPIIALRSEYLVIGFLNNTSPEIRRVELAAFHRGLNEGGYFERQNVRIEYHWAQGQYDRLQELAGDLAHAPVSVLVATGGEQVALAPKAATATIPTVFIIAGDPVKIGLVASLNRPGGNITGFSLLDTLTEAKRLEVAHELVSGAPLIAFLVNPNNPITEFSRAICGQRRTRSAKSCLSSGPAPVTSWMQPLRMWLNSVRVLYCSRVTGSSSVSVIG